MSARKVGWIAASAVLVVTTQVAVSAGASAGSPARSTAAGAAPRNGFFITGQGRVTPGTRPAVFFRDPQGGEHVVTTKRAPSVSGDRGHIEFSSKKAGSSRWVTYQVPGLRPMSGGIRIERDAAYRNPARSWFVFYQSNGVFADAASSTATRLPEPTLVTSTNICKEEPSACDNGPVSDAAAFQGDLGIVLPDPAQQNLPAIWAGTSPGTFVPGVALTSKYHFRPAIVANTPVDGRDYAVGYGSDDGVKGIYLLGMQIQGDDTGTWVANRIATLDSTTSDYKIVSLAFTYEKMWVGLSLPRGTSHRTHTLFIDSGNKGLEANEFILRPLAHSTIDDSHLRLAYNAKSGHLHAVFTRVNPASHTRGSGIMKEKLTTSWSKPTFVTHWYRDYADQIAFTKNGRDIISYNQK